MDNKLDQLLAMSRTLGDPANDYVILGEGNTSARCDEDSFWVKASGFSLNDITQDGLVAVNFRPILDLFEQDDLSDEAVAQALLDARVDSSTDIRPSVETTFHALALSMGGANFIGHTHPTAVNSILCSEVAEAAIAGRLFPDEIVVCGPAPALVPYVDPGLPLAQAIRHAILGYQEEYGRNPKLIYMQNHGMIALGASADEVLRITAMAVKTARILQGAYAMGGPQFMSAENVARIDSRLDEHYRQRMLAKQAAQ